MKTKHWTLLLLLMGTIGCSSIHHDLTAPCHNFGKTCQKTPINALEYPSANAGDKR